jgi:pimeloyl-ACP methyl ester carboxylesterase
MPSAPSDWTDRFVTIGRGPIHVRIAAGRRDAPALVFLHEGLGSAALWRGFPDDVRAACGSPSALVFSRHGYGRSAIVRESRTVDYMHREALDVLPALLAELHIDQPVLIGHSDGGSIALIHAGAGHPVAGLVLLAPHVFVEDETVAGIDAARTTYETTDLRERLARHHDDSDATFRGWNDIWLSPEFRAWNIEGCLAGVGAPALLIQGDADRFGTLAQLDAIERGTSGAVERLVVAGAGHSPHLDDPAQVVAAVAGFWRRITSQPSQARAHHSIRTRA